jgi:DNA-directed RNA polymerase specialized sigma24 family protein
VDEVEILLRTDDPLARVQMASSSMDRHRVAIARLATIRGQALLELRARGHSAADLAGMLGVTRQQIHRLLREALGREADGR